MNEAQLPLETLQKLYKSYSEKFEDLKKRNLALDMTRGKPGAEQLDLTNALDGILQGSYMAASDTDTRNYGGLVGILEARELFAPVLSVEVDEMIVGGNSSLSLMYQYMDHAFHHGTTDKKNAWKDIPNVAFLCPVPGYDRHFSICEFLGIRMIPVPLHEDGPDLQVIETLLKEDPGICGMWSVPKYSNPGGVVYSPENIEGLCKLFQLARPEFRLMWDNAYALHDLVDHPEELAPVLSIAKKYGTEDKVVLFGSTSKITFAGAGVAFCGMSRANRSSFINYLSFQTIGPDKINQLRHVKFFGTTENIRAHMKKHKDILVPKFDTVISALESACTEYPFLTWTRPKGGYFVSVYTQPGLASEVVSLCAELGVKITPAGATYPYGKDPENSNIRLAPSFPDIQQIELAMEAFTTAVGLASTRASIS
jgi:DNA-binding transcriptional MocR family regulator